MSTPKLDDLACAYTSLQAFLGPRTRTTSRSSAA
ncbi:MAG: hypothetical protein ACLTYW_06490 [Collinsella sp.]